MGRRNPSTFTATIGTISSRASSTDRSHPVEGNRHGMNAWWDELAGGIPDGNQLARISIRLFFSAILGAVVGIQREQTGKPAGLRTHMLVALGATLFVLVPVELAAGARARSRAIQGVATGIGFIGGRAILKSAAERELPGLASAAVRSRSRTVGV